MRRPVALVLSAFVLVLSTSGCKRLLGSLLKDKDAGDDASAAVASAEPDPSATASAAGSGSAAPTATTKPPTAKAKAVVKKAVPKCAAGQSLFADDDTSPPFCSKICSSDTECKPAKCDRNAFSFDGTTGEAFVGVGRSITVCNQGGDAGAASAAPSGSAASPAASAGPASSSITLAIPPGAPGVIQNPNHQPCPPGYNNAGGVLKTCNKVCTVGGKCPLGTKCNEALLVCK
jgi:hypothetical protein